MDEKPTRRFTGIFIPVEIIDAADLSWIQRILWAQIHALHDVRRGGCFASDEYLAEILGVSPRSVANDLSHLRKNGWIRRESPPNSPRILTVRHPNPTSPFGEVTSPNSETGITKQGSPLHQTVKSVYRERKDEIKEVKPPTAPQGAECELGLDLGEIPKAKVKPEVEAIWQAYPRKVNRKPGLRAIATALKKISFEELLPHVKKFALTCAKTEARYIAHPATWFNQERWTNPDEPTNRPTTLQHAHDYSNAAWLKNGKPLPPSSL